MKITQIAIEIHEKRNHPYEYGHYDASCRLTADIEGTDDPDEVMGTLRMVARAEVQVELDNWIKRIKHQRQQIMTRNDIYSEIRNLWSAKDRPATVANIEERILTELTDTGDQEELLVALGNRVRDLDDSEHKSAGDDGRQSDDWDDGEDGYEDGYEGEEDGDNCSPESPF